MPEQNTPPPVRLVDANTGQSVDLVKFGPPRHIVLCTHCYAWTKTVGDWPMQCDFCGELFPEMLGKRDG